MGNVGTIRSRLLMEKTACLLALDNMSEQAEKISPGKTNLPGLCVSIWMLGREGLYG